MMPDPVEIQLPISFDVFLVVKKEGIEHVAAAEIDTVFMRIAAPELQPLPRQGAENFLFILFFEFGLPVVWGRREKMLSPFLCRR